MAMKPCNECKKPISTDAKTCPNCGKKNPTTTTTSSGVRGSLLALFFLGVIVSALTPTSKSSDTAVPSAPVVAPKPPPSSLVSEGILPRAEKTNPDAKASASTLGLSYDQVTKNFGQLVKMEKSSDVDGQPRYMGYSSNKLAILEVIGSKKDVSQASLMLGLPNDSPATVVTNSGLLVRFMKNVVPERAESFDWVNSAMEKTISSGVPVDVVVGHKNIKFQIMKPMGMFLVSVKPQSVTP